MRPRPVTSTSNACARAPCLNRSAAWASSPSFSATSFWKRATVSGGAASPARIGWPSTSIGRPICAVAVA